MPAQLLQGSGADGAQIIPGVGNELLGAGATLLVLVLTVAVLKRLTAPADAGAAQLLRRQPAEGTASAPSRADPAPTAAPTAAALAASAAADGAAPDGAAGSRTLPITVQRVGCAESTVLDVLPSDTVSAVTARVLDLGWAASAEQVKLVHKGRVLEQQARICDALAPSTSCTVFAVVSPGGPQHAAASARTSGHGADAPAAMVRVQVLCPLSASGPRAQARGADPRVCSWHIVLQRRTHRLLSCRPRIPQTSTSSEEVLVRCPAGWQGTSISDLKHEVTAFWVRAIRAAVCCRPMWPRCGCTF